MADNQKFNTTWIQPQKPANFDDPNHDLKYKNSDIKRLLSNSSIIQKIINTIQKSAIL